MTRAGQRRKTCVILVGFSVRCLIPSSNRQKLWTKRLKANARPVVAQEFYFSNVLLVFPIFSEPLYMTDATSTTEPNGPLNQSQQHEVAAAHERAGKIRKAASVARFNGWMTGIFAACSAPFALFSLPVSKIEKRIVLRLFHPLDTFCFLRPLKPRLQYKYRKQNYQDKQNCITHSAHLNLIPFFSVYRAIQLRYDKQGIANTLHRG